MHVCARVRVARPWSVWLESAEQAAMSRLKLWKRHCGKRLGNCLEQLEALFVCMAFLCNYCSAEKNTGHGGIY